MGAENIPATMRLGTSTKSFSPKIYSSNWSGNQYTKTYNVGTALIQTLRLQGNLY